MKRTLSIALLSAGLVSFAACGGGGDNKKSDDKSAEKAKDDDGGAADDEKKAEGGDEKKADGGDEKKAEAAAPASGGGGGGGAPGDTTKYVPDSAVFLAHVNIKSISSSPMWGANKAAMENDPETKKTIEALKKCNLDVDGFDSLTMAGDENDHAVVIVVGGGMGVAKNLECVGESMKEDIGEGNWKVEDRDGEKVVVIDGGKQIGHMMDDNTLVVASSDWDATVKELAGGGGTAAVNGKLKDAVANADTSKNIWFAARVPESAGGQLKGSPAEGLAYVAGSVDLGEGIGVDIKAGTASAEKAAALKEFLVATYGQYKGMAPMVGIPPELADKVEFGTADSAATATLKLNKAEVDQIKANMEAMGGGAAGR